LRYACRAAASHLSKVIFLTVADTAEGYARTAPAGYGPLIAPFAPASAAIKAPTRDKEALKEMEHELRTYLEIKAAPFRNRGIDVECAVESGDAATVIIDYARSRAVDLIVMATHGRTGLERVVFGSVAEAVLRSGTAPVLLVRPQDLVKNKEAKARN
jgi:nucleotide-binding universal stress UspA family protein